MYTMDVLRMKQEARWRTYTCAPMNFFSSGQSPVSWSRDVCVGVVRLRAAEKKGNRGEERRRALQMGQASWRRSTKQAPTQLQRSLG